MFYRSERRESTLITDAVFSPISDDLRQNSWTFLLVSHFSVMASVLRGCISRNAIINAAAGKQGGGQDLK